MTAPAKRSIRSNFAYNALITGLNAFLPLATYPYVTRVLGPDNLGRVNFFNSIADWFILLMSLGISAYGIREVARNRDNHEAVSHVFSELILIMFGSMLFFLGAYAMMYALMPKLHVDPWLFIIFSLPLLFNVFSIDWLYGGFERYDYIAKRGVIIRILYVGLVFMLVERPEDYRLFAGLTVLVIVATNSANALFSRNLVRFTLNGLNLRRHVKPIATLYGCILVGSLYAKGDIVLLGMMSSERYVAYYSLEKKVVQVSLAVASALSAVLIPRLSYLLKNNQAQEYNKLLSKSFSFIIFISLPLIAYICVFQLQIVELLGGWEFLEAAGGLRVIAPVILLSNVAGFIGSQYMMPQKEEKKILYMTAVAALSNLTINFVLVPSLFHIGSSIAIVGSEMIGVVMGFIYIRKNKEFEVFTKQNKQYFLASILSGLTCYLVTLLITYNEIVKFVSISAMFAFTYIAILLLMKDPFVLQLFRRFRKCEE